MRMKTAAALAILPLSLFLVSCSEEEPTPAPEPIIVASFDDCVNQSAVVTESDPRTCDFNGVTFTEDVVEPELPPKEQAYEVGRQAGEAYNDMKKTSKDFWDGFTDETTVDQTLRDLGSYARKKASELQK